MVRSTVLLLCAIVLLGCTPIRQTALKVSEEELQNAVVTRTIAMNYLEVWPIQSGLIRGALGPRMDEMPAQAVDAMEELDLLADACNQEESGCTDKDLGLSLGLRIRLLGSVVQETIATFAPDVLQYVPLVF